MGITDGIRLSALLAALGHIGPDHYPDLPIKTMQHDSRRVLPGQDTLYLCLARDPIIAKQHLSQAIANGAVAAVTAHSILVEEYDSTPLVVVEALHARLSRVFETFFSIDLASSPVIAVTGTNGKTSVAHHTAQCLHGIYVGTLGMGWPTQLMSTNNTTPVLPELLQQICPLLQTAPKDTPIVLEASSHGLVQQRLMDLPVKTAVFTNLTEEHLDYHGSMAEYATAKFLLFQREQLQRAVINLDSAWCQPLLKVLRHGLQVMTFGQDTAADIHPLRAEFTQTGMNFCLQTPLGLLEGTLPLIGQFNLANIMAVISVLMLHGHTIEDIQSNLGRIEPVPGRMETMISGGVRFVVDYAHTADALANALTALRPTTEGRLWCVFGCGGNRDVGKRKHMGRIAEAMASPVVLTSDNPRFETPLQIIEDILSGVDDVGKVMIIPDRRQAIRFCCLNATPGDTVLIAGKGHEDYQQVGDSRLVHSDRAWLCQCLTCGDHRA